MHLGHSRAYLQIDCMWPGGGDLGSFDHDLEAFTLAFGAAGIEVSLSPGIFVSQLNATWISQHRAAVQVG
jgi:hypothetical protein